MLLYDEHRQGLDRTAQKVASIVEAAYKQMLADIRGGMSAAEATNKAFAYYSGRYYKLFAEAMSKRLRDGMSITEAQAYRVSGVTLSSNLYQAHLEAQRVVENILRQHVRGWQDARQLASELYDGYGFAQARGTSDPLVSRGDPLPRYLRKAFADDAVMRAAIRSVGPDFKALGADIEIGPSLATRLAKARAARLRTPALKASYLDSIDALEKGAGQKRLDRLLRTAWEEKQRYHANRIAQTELHRVWSDGQAEEIRRDALLTAVQIVMSATHPVEDICDLHARVDKFGLGPGVYPKALAPRPPFHPFCRCRQVKKYAIDATNAREKPGAEAAYLRSLSKGFAARVAGSNAKLEAVLQGQAVKP